MKSVYSPRIWQNWHLQGQIYCTNSHSYLDKAKFILFTSSLRLWVRDNICSGILCGHVVDMNTIGLWMSCVLLFWVFVHLDKGYCRVLPYSCTSVYAKVDQSKPLRVCGEHKLYWCQCFKRQMRTNCSLHLCFADVVNSGKIAQNFKLSTDRESWSSYRSLWVLNIFFENHWQRGLASLIGGTLPYHTLLGHLGILTLHQRDSSFESQTAGMTSHFPQITYNRCHLLAQRSLSSLHISIHIAVGKVMTQRNTEERNWFKCQVPVFKWVQLSGYRHQYIFYHKSEI